MRLAFYLILHTVKNNFVNRLQDDVDSISLEILFLLISDFLEEYTLKKEEDPVWKVEIIRWCLHNQIYQLLTIWVMPLQVEWT